MPVTRQDKTCPVCGEFLYYRVVVEHLVEEHGWVEDVASEYGASLTKQDE